MKDIWTYSNSNLSGKAECCPHSEEDSHSEAASYSEADNYSEAGGRRKACKAKGLRAKPFRECLRKMRLEDKGKSKSELRKLKKERKKDWKNVKPKIKQQWRKAGQAFYQRAWKNFAKIAPPFILMRTSFRFLINLNVWDFANKIYRLEQSAKDGDKRAEKAYAKLRRKWEGFGGNPDKLMQSVRAGQMKKPLIIRFRRRGGVDGFEDWDVYVEENGERYSYLEPATIAAAIEKVVESTPIIGAVGDILGAVSIVIGALPLDKKDKEGIEDVAQDEIDRMRLTDEQRDILEAGIEEDDGDDKILGMPKTAFWIGTSVLAAGVIGLVIWAATRKK